MPPKCCWGLLFYAYATGVFSSRKIEQGTRETAAFRYLAGNLSPDHNTIAAFRKSFLPELSGLFVQMLSLAQETGLLQLGNISLDGTKIHADVSKSKAVSYKRLLEIEAKWQAEVAELFALAENADSRAVPEGMDAPTKSPADNSASNASPKRKLLLRPAPPKKRRSSRPSMTRKGRRGRPKRSRRARNPAADRLRRLRLRPKRKSSTILPTPTAA